MAAQLPVTAGYFFFVGFLAAAFAFEAGLALAADFGAGFLAMGGLEGESFPDCKASLGIARAISAPRSRSARVIPFDRGANVCCRAAS